MGALITLAKALAIPAAIAVGGEIFTAVAKKAEKSPPGSRWHTVEKASKVVARLSWTWSNSPSIRKGKK